MSEIDKLQKKVKKLDPDTPSPTANDALKKGQNGIYLQAGYEEEEIKRMPAEVQKEISEHAVNQMVAEGYFEEDPSTLDPEARREEIWRFRCMGVHKDAIMKVLGISRRQYYYDVKKHDDKMKDELIALGSAGYLARGMNYYEHLKDEAMTQYNALPETATSSERALLLRLCKDIEDSKNKLLLGVGAIQRSKPRMHEELVDDSDINQTPTSDVKNVLDDILLEMSNGVFSARADDDGETED